MINWVAAFWRQFFTVKEAESGTKQAGTIASILEDHMLQLKIRTLVEQEYTDQQIAKRLNLRPHSVRRFRLSQGWRRR